MFFKKKPLKLSTKYLKKLIQSKKGKLASQFYMSPRVCRFTQNTHYLHFL